jgi:hypothetical protein
VETHPDFAPSF